MSKLNTAINLVQDNKEIELDAFITAMQAAFADLSAFNATCYFNTANRKLGLARRAKSGTAKKKATVKASKPKKAKKVTEAPVAEVVKDIDAIRAKNLETIKKVAKKHKKAKKEMMDAAEEPTIEAAVDFEEKEDIDQLLAVIAN